jgi:AraC-like DNA-binding protein
MEKSIKRAISDYNTNLRLTGYNVFEIESDKNAPKVYSRKDFFKICLTTGRSKIHYADRSFETEGTVLFFGNPHVPYSWESLSSHYVGYTCLFSEDFLRTTGRSNGMLNSPLFRLGGTPILSISEKQREFLNGLFIRMIEEQQSKYNLKDDLIRNYIHLIFHEALKMEPSENYNHHHNAASRISKVFFELLERQFPIEIASQPLSLKTAREYAFQLSIHVNHLNHSLKETTGKTTTTLINERILCEAKALLQHTNWNVSEIAFALGFEYPTYFNNFLRFILFK